MEFTSKNYKIKKTKFYLQTNSLFFFYNGVNQNSDDGVFIEQSLKNMNFNYHKVFNKTSINTLNDSVFKIVKPTINGVTFFIKPSSKSKQLSKEVLFNNLEPLLFIMLAIKLNTKIYTTTQLKNTNSFKYQKNKLILFQFGVTSLKYFLPNNAKLKSK